MNFNNKAALVADSEKTPSRPPASDPYEVWRRTIRDEQHGERDGSRDDSADPYQVWRHLIRT